MKLLNAPLLALMLALPLAACGEHSAPASQQASADPQADTTLGKQVRDATDKAREKLAEGNISIGSDGSKVELSPTGDLLINGTSVPLNDSQRAITVQYRKQVVEIAEAGIEIGVQGANLGVRAAGEALKGIFSGDTDKIEERVNAEAEKLQAHANKICDKMPALMATQQQLAAAVPEFRPYAKMEQSDIDECRNGHIQSR